MYVLQQTVSPGFFFFLVGAKNAWFGSRNSPFTFNDVSMWISYTRDICLNWWNYKHRILVLNSCQGRHVITFFHSFIHDRHRWIDKGFDWILIVMTSHDVSWAKYLENQYLENCKLLWILLDFGLNSTITKSWSDWAACVFQKQTI